MENLRFTAYCGLFCADCIPGNKELFHTVKKLEHLLEQSAFAHYAVYKSQKSGIFAKYGNFLRVLREIKRLECTGSCYDGPVSDLGCTPDCPIRACVREKGFEGCWDCPDHSECDKLAEYKEFHPGLEQNLATIRNLGVQNWIPYRGKHYRWS